MYWVGEFLTRYRVSFTGLNFSSRESFFGNLMCRRGAIISCFGVSEPNHKVAGRRGVTLMEEEERKRGSRNHSAHNEHSVVITF